MNILVYTKNRKKLRELQRILGPLGIGAVCEDDLSLSLPEVEETGATFEENARIKADCAARASGLPAVADDSGLCVDALGGAPGVYSARYAGEGVSDAEKVKKLLLAMSDVPDGRRAARFVCALCLATPRGERLFVRGECGGTIARAPRGEGGFGYDPVFLIGDKSFAELNGSEKDEISHRGRALRALAAQVGGFLESCGEK